MKKTLNVLSVKRTALSGHGGVRQMAFGNSSKSSNGKCGGGSNGGGSQGGHGK